MSKNIINMIENSKVMHPITTAAIADKRYWKDFLCILEDYKKVLSTQEYNDFLSKSQLDCKINMPQYLQFASEITIVDYIIRHYNNNFVNEPKYNSNKNPECSFEYNGRTINIEVKCPDLSKRIQQEHVDNIKILASERFPNKEDYLKAIEFIESHIPNNEQIQNVDRLDNKLKDYLLSAHAKFPNSNSSNFNILVIALDIIQDMDEWYSYLFGTTGAFTNQSYIAEDYSNVDAVLLTNIQHGHMADDINPNINCWHLENYISLLLLNPSKEHLHGLGKYYFETAHSLFGKLTDHFISFLESLDYQNENREKKIINSNLSEDRQKALFHILYTGDIITNLHIISKWVNSLNLPQ